MTFLSYDPPGSDATSGPNDSEDDTLWGWDDTELVGVGLSPDEQLREIRIDPSWKSRIDADLLSSAVFSAYMGAVMARVASNPSGAPVIAPTPDQPAGPSGGTAIPVIDVSLMEEVDRERDDYLATFQDSLAEELAFSSVDRNVTVTARGGSPVSIAFEPTWMKFAEARHIADSTREALDPAIRSGQAIAARMREQFPAIAEFRRLREIKKAARGF